MTLPVRSFMTSNPATIDPDAKIWEAANTVLDRRVGGLPVINDEGHLLGIIRESDVLHRGEIHADGRHGRWRTLFASRASLAEEYAKAFGQDVGEVMSSPAVAVEPETPIEAAAELMAKNNIKRTTSNACRWSKTASSSASSHIPISCALSSGGLTQHSGVKADADIRNALEAELAGPS